MQNRYYPRITITLPPEMLADLTAYQKAQGLKRSNIIQFALRDWLVRQQPIVNQLPDNNSGRHILMVNGQPFDPDKLLMHYLPSNFSPDEYMIIEHQYVTAEKAYYSG